MAGVLALLITIELLLPSKVILLDFVKFGRSFINRRLLNAARRNLLTHCSNLMRHLTKLYSSNPD